MFLLMASAFVLVPRAPRYHLRSTEFDEAALIETTTSKMAKSLESLKANLQTLRTGRASPDILARIKVDYYGAETPLNQLASVSVSGSQLVVSPYDKSVMKDIDSALLEANLGMTPSNDGEVIRLNIPALTEDRRKQILKQAKSVGEEAKVAVRNIRRGANDEVKKLEKAKTISEDLSRNVADDIQKATDKTIKDIESVVAAKEKDIMTV